MPSQISTYTPFYLCFELYCVYTQQDTRTIGVLAGMSKQSATGPGSGAGHVPMTPNRGKMRAPPGPPGLESAVTTPVSGGAGSGMHRPVRLTSLHYVTTFSHTPDSSPLSPSVAVPAGTLPLGSMTPLSLYSGSRQIPGPRRDSKTRTGPAFSGHTGSPGIYYGPSSSVSSLGLESGYLDHHGSAVESSSSSSDEEDDVRSGYDSDDRMSLAGSRRSSLTGRLPTLLGPAPQHSAIRQMLSSLGTLKNKSFLRISKELQDEMSPLDYELRHEAEITSSLRDDLKLDGRMLAPALPASSSNEADGVPKKPSEEVFRFDEEPAGHEPLTSIEPNERPFSGEENGIQANGIVKRKMSVVEESLDAVAFKRRAVSPGVASPIIGSPTSNIGRRATSVRHVHDASDELKNMRLL